MTQSTDAARIARLRRMQRVRAIERTTAMRDAAEQMDRHRRLETLARRSETLAPKPVTGPASGADLAASASFTAQVSALIRQTAQDSRDAAGEATLAATRLAQADHRCTVLRDRADDAVRDLARDLARNVKGKG
ncbi:hypothetical protein HME9302_00320 [Alteripontixanthobacter maritimus]|uniref:Uncharacterized protein n=1 Tax=Alteripontixanthobacter maritimus TaxID=2161824 RepID=A0A369Q6J7_9SPHN|nr:hypothetical protein [Alteripontixanthobacter maritimus]RDC59135.1 hypothetical protein HME9302_00320 [Alteripontixanthobacter maritimus]